MYNLLVSADNESWSGDPWVIETSRCVREYTDNAITIKYGDLMPDNVNDLRRFPCVFAYETGCKKDPLFGLIRNVVSRQKESRIEYDIIKVAPFLTVAIVGRPRNTSLTKKRMRKKRLDDVRFDNPSILVEDTRLFVRHVPSEM